MLKKNTLFFLILCPLFAKAQVHHQLSFQYNESKDQLNNGLLFKGGNLKYEFGKETVSNHFKVFNSEIGVGSILNDGLLGFDVTLKPVDYFHGFRMYEKHKTELFLGPNLNVSYRGQLFPNLQMGHLLWMTAYSLAPQIIVNRTISGERILRFTTSSSILALTSRPQKIDDHFFSLMLTDIVSDLHSNMQLGSYNMFHDTKFTIELFTKGTKNSWSIGYALNVLAYTQSPSFDNATHSLIIKRFNKWK